MVRPAAPRAAPSACGTMATCPSFGSPSPRSITPWATWPATPPSCSIYRPRPRPRGAHLVAFPEMMLTGYPPEDLVFRPIVPGGVASDARQPWPPISPTPGLGDIAVIVGYLDDDRRTPQRRRVPARRPGRRDATSSTTCPTTACSTSTATSSAATVHRRAAARRRHRADDLRRRLAGRRPVRAGPRGRRRPRRQHQRLALRAQQGRRAAAPCCSGGRSRPARRSPM